MSYLNVSEVETAIVNLASANPGTCSLITLPNKSFEGRTCHALRLGAGTPGSRDCVMLIGGQHAREWGSCEILVNLAADLLEAFAENTGLAYGGKSFTAAQIQGVMGGLHIVIFPLVNPDGRKFSQDGTDWRKNRNPAYSDGDPACIGVDLNRNYDFLFDYQTAFSSSLPFADMTNPCLGTFQGPSPFSEPESKNVRWLVDAFPPTRWFVDLHSGDQSLRLNWGDDESQSTNPSMNFRNPAYDGQRGVLGDSAYKEYFPADDLAVETALAQRITDAILAVRGIVYPFDIGFIIGNGALPGAAKDYVFSRHFVDPGKGKIFGYTLEWGEFQPPWSEMELIIQDVCAGLIELCVEGPCVGGIIAVGLDTPSLVFEDVPEGVETSRAAVFSVQSCSAVNFDVSVLPTVESGPGTFNLSMGIAPLPAAPDASTRETSLWVSFKGQAPGTMTTGSMTVHCQETGEDFVIPILANSIQQPKVASMLVLDRSGSMDDPSGISGKKRIDVLHASAPKFVALLPDQDAIGVVAFDENAELTMPLKEVNEGGIAAATTTIGAHMTKPNALTAIGDGVELAHNQLKNLAGYDSTAIVVFTDGKDTASKSVDEILDTGLLDGRVFAIGLGTAQEVDAVVLNQLTGNHDGYLLMTGALGNNDQLRIDKYFVQILAGVTNAEVVVDPEGALTPDVEVKIPFYVTEADYGVDAIVLSPAPWAFDFQLETPAGLRIDHAALGGVLGVRFATADEIAFYRMSLPVVSGGAGAHQGRWYVVLKVTTKRWHDYLHWAREHYRGAGDAAQGVRYSVNIHARSSLRFAANLYQATYEPGAALDLRAVLTEIGLPIEKRARVRADIKRPDGTNTVVPLEESEPGVFTAHTIAPVAGIYSVRFRAIGTTLRGAKFTREQLRTGVVTHRRRKSTEPQQPGSKHSTSDPTQNAARR